MLQLYKIRIAVGAVVLTLALFFMGVGELCCCLRTILPPSQVSYTEANEKGLGGYGYVRLKEVRLGVQRAAAIVKQRRDGSGTVGEEWDGVFVPVEPAFVTGQSGETDDGGSAERVWPSGKYTVLVYMPEARRVEDVLPLVGATELLCHVDTTFPNLNPGYQTLVRSLAGSRGENCWVVEVRRPSWLKGLGWTGGAVVIVGAFVVWRIRQPL